MPRLPKKSPVRHTPAVSTPARRTTADASAIAAATPAAVTAPAAVVAATPAVVAAPIAVKTPEFPAEMVARLRAPMVETAVSAAETLARTADARVVPALVAALENRDGYCHVVVRAAAAMALGRFNEPAAVTALLAGARDGMAEVSTESILALGDLKAVAAVELLCEIVANASGFYLPTTRHAAVRALGRMRSPAAQPLLTALASNGSEDASLTAAAREAIAAR